jgi:hypothetical protein
LKLEHDELFSIFAFNSKCRYAKWHEPPRDALDTLVLGQVDRTTLEAGAHIHPLFSST